MSHVANSAALMWAAAIAGAMAYVSAAEAASDLPAPFVYLSEIDPRIQQDVRYASENNFLGRTVDGYTAPQCILTRKTAQSLKKVEDALLKKNLSLKVYDCYRPARSVRDFARWSHKDGDEKMKQQYYPDYDKDELFARGFIVSHSSHSRGNTVDLTIVPVDSTVPQFDPAKPLARCDAPQEQRSPDNSLDFGTGFDCFGPKSRTRAEQISQAAKDNRRILVEAMVEEGFWNYFREWWHFQKSGAAMDEEYNFPICAPGTAADR